MRKSQFFIITGPECSGKSWLTESLAEEYNLPWLEEAARWFLPALNREYNYDDLIDLSRIEAIQTLNYQFSASPLVLVDTWLLVMRVWMEVRYGRCEQWISHLPAMYNEIHYFLCMPDIPWVYDPLRENPDDRWDLYEKYRILLEQLNLNYTVIKGSKQRRMEKAGAILKPFLKT